jgi:hypothetical protein
MGIPKATLPIRKSGLDAVLLEMKNPKGLPVGHFQIPRPSHFYISTSLHRFRFNVVSDY